MLAEIQKLEQKVENTEAEVKLQKRLLERTNQPQNFILKDIERAEKESEFANRKINQLEAQLKRSKNENEQLKLQKARINDDLQRLMAKRGEIEQLQTALMGIIRHSSNRKVDIDELRQLLSTQLKGMRSGPMNDSTASLDMQPSRMKAATVGRGSSSHNRSRSRSKGHTHATIPASNPMMGASMADMRSSAATAKVVQSFGDDSAVPAWYKSLKKNLN